MKAIHPVISKIAKYAFTGVLLIFLYLSVLVFLKRAGKVYWSETPSLWYGFYACCGRGRLKAGDIVAFPPPEKAKEIFREMGEELDYDMFIKRIERIEGDSAYVRGWDTERLKEYTGVDGLQSFDSRFYGNVELKNCRKVVHLPFASFLMLRMIKVYDRIYG